MNGEEYTRVEVIVGETQNTIERVCANRDRGHTIDERRECVETTHDR